MIEKAKMATVSSMIEIESITMPSRNQIRIMVARIMVGPMPVPRNAS